MAELCAALAAREAASAEALAARFRGRKAANGQVFSDQALTAAHRTLPMGSLITVTNLKTGQSSAMRITDRGPFVDGRIVDLTIASAKATGVYRVGAALVRVDVFQAPKPIERGVRWCVQIGVFKDADNAEALKHKLKSRYADAEVLEFAGPTGHWVRIRPPHDDKRQAYQIAENLRPVEGNAYLVRLD